MLKKLMELRKKLKGEAEALISAAETESRGMNEAESAEFDAKMAEIRKLDERITELGEAEAREVATAKFYADNEPVDEVRKETATVSVKHEPNPVYRKNDASTSYFRDLAGASKNDQGAISRLIASQETRALSTTANAGGQFAPPQWQIDNFVALARPARVTADLMNKNPLPGGVSSINLPKVSSGTTAAVQATQNNAVSNTDAVTSSVTSGITTIAGQQVVSLQLLAQSGIPFDEVILQDLALAYATQVDLQVINGTGSSGQLRGILQGAGITTTTFTSASPAVTSATAANSYYNKVISAVNSVYVGRYLPPTAIIMHPTRWSWILEALDTATRPLVTPDGPMFNGVGRDDPIQVAQGQSGTLLGLPVYVDPNVPTNLGAGTNQDPTLVVRASDLWLYETPVQAATFEATYAYNASVLYRVLGYSAFIPDRYGASVSVVNGTGTITPTL